MAGPFSRCQPITPVVHLRRDRAHNYNKTDFPLSEEFEDDGVDDESPVKNAVERVDDRSTAKVAVAVETVVANNVREDEAAKDEDQYLKFPVQEAQYESFELVVCDSQRRDSSSPSLSVAAAERAARGNDDDEETLTVICIGEDNYILVEPNHQILVEPTSQILVDPNGNGNVGTRARNDNLCLFEIVAPAINPELRRPVLEETIFDATATNAATASEAAPTTTASVTSLDQELDLISDLVEEENSQRTEKDKIIEELVLALHQVEDRVMHDEIQSSTQSSQATPSGYSQVAERVRTALPSAYPTLEADEKALTSTYRLDAVGALDADEAEEAIGALDAANASDAAAAAAATFPASPPEPPSNSSSVEGPLEAALPVEEGRRKIVIPSLHSHHHHLDDSIDRRWPMKSSSAENTFVPLSRYIPSSLSSLEGSFPRQNRIHSVPAYWNANSANGGRDSSNGYNRNDSDNNFRDGRDNVNDDNDADDDDEGVCLDLSMASVRSRDRVSDGQNASPSIYGRPYHASPSATLYDGPVHSPRSPAAASTAPLSRRRPEDPPPPPPPLPPQLPVDSDPENMVIDVVKLDSPVVERAPKEDPFRAIFRPTCIIDHQSSVITAGTASWQHATNATTTDVFRAIADTTIIGGGKGTTTTTTVTTTQSNEGARRQSAAAAETNPNTAQEAAAAAAADSETPTMMWQQQQQQRTPEAALKSQTTTGVRVDEDANVESVGHASSIPKVVFLMGESSGDSCSSSSGSGGEERTVKKLKLKELVKLSYEELNDDVIGELSIDDFHELLASKSKEEQLKLKEIRRRFQNKDAARSCRKRKQNKIDDLKKENEKLEAVERKLLQEDATLKPELKKRKTDLENYTKEFSAHISTQDEMVIFCKIMNE